MSDNEKSFFIGLGFIFIIFSPIMLGFHGTFGFYFFLAVGIIMEVVTMLAPDAK